MGQIENMWRQSVGRRKALLGLSGALAGASLLRAQQDPTRLLKDHRRPLGFEEMINAFDFEPVFKSNVPQLVCDYVAHGSDSEWTVLRNREAFGWVNIIPRPSVDISAVNLSIDLFGMKWDTPLFIAPSRIMMGVHPEGTPALRRGASDAKTIYFIPSDPSFHDTSDRTRMAQDWNETVKAASFPFCWQFYPNSDLKASREALEKMQADGARAIAVTVDQQSAYYPRSQENRNLGGRPVVRKPSQAATPPERNSKARWWYNWKYLDQLREIIKVPALVKSIMTPEDAELCVQHGFDGIYVSNHGGRSLCYLPSTLEVLPEIVAAVRGRVPVLFDSGIRNGTDAFKALALGATAVGIGGRPSQWAMGAYGAPGVTRLLEIMKKELTSAMANAGRPTTASLDQSAVKTRFV